MKFIHISTTKLKTDTADILNMVAYGNTEAIIERHGEPLVRIVPIKELKRSTEEVRNAIDITFGSLPDFPEVTKFRRSGRRKIAPLF